MIARPRGPLMRILNRKAGMTVALTLVFCSALVPLGLVQPSGAGGPAGSLLAQDLDAELEQLQEELNRLEEELEEPQVQVGPADEVDVQEPVPTVEADDTATDHPRPDSNGNIIGPGFVRLNVPFVRQNLGPVCGPASLEMVFRYWGENRYDQYEIARRIVLKFSDVDRYRAFALQVRSGRSLNWREYPGTGTSAMREFLEGLAPTQNKRIRRVPAEPAAAARVRSEFFENLKNNLRDGVPVIVHQNWSEQSTSGHYRVVTGYDESRRIVFLNDARVGPIEQDYARFFRLWNVAEAWLPYNSIAFNVRATGQLSRPMRLNLP